MASAPTLRPAPPRSDPAARRSRFAALARWCATHRALTIGLWLLGAVVLTLAGNAAGRQEISSVRLPGTESQRAYDVLAAHFPAENGDTDQVVFSVRRGSLADQRAAVTRTVAALRRQPVVAAVTDPLAQGGELSPDGRVGVAELTYRGSIDDVATADLERVDAAARAEDSPALAVAHGGAGAESVRDGGSGPSEGIGVAAAAVVLLLTFGSALAAGLPLLTALLALASTLGAIKLVSHLVDTPDFAAQLATLIGLGVGIDYALFVVTRYRSELAAGCGRVEAIEAAADTAGRTIFVAALTVVIALLGMVLLGLSFLHGVAVGAALAVLATLLGGLSLLPALLALAGPRIDSRRRRRAQAAGRERAEGHRWEAWSRAVQRRPRLAAGTALALLLGLCLPTLGLRLGTADAGVDPEGSTTRLAYDRIAAAFGPGVNGTLQATVTLPRTGDRATADRVAAVLRQDPGVAGVDRPALSPDGAVATITATPTSGPQSQATQRTLERLRASAVPEVERATGADVALGGLTAAEEDFTDVIAGKLGLFIGAVVLLSALVLVAAFRSVVIPVKAAILNGLSIGASLGVVTLVFQDGAGAGLLGIGTGPIEPFVPILVFAIVFGLSMDYEVFLLSRVREEVERGSSPSEAVVRGIATTGRVITAAATIMVLVFGAFALGDDRTIKLFGIGLASAIALDALVIRCLLVPAVMELLGRRAWYIPRWVDRAVPHLRLERS